MIQSDLAIHIHWVYVYSDFFRFFHNISQINLNKLLGQPNICVYTYIIFFSTLFHSRLLQDIEYSSLCYTVNPSFSNISYFEMMAKEVMVKNSELGGFTGSSVVKNPLANGGAIGWILGLERSHMPLSNKVHVPQLLSLCSRAWKPQLPKPT